MTLLCAIFMGNLCGILTASASMASISLGWFVYMMHDCSYMGIRIFNGVLLFYPWALRPSSGLTVLLGCSFTINTSEPFHRTLVRNFSWPLHLPFSWPSSWWFLMSIEVFGKLYSFYSFIRVSVSVSWTNAANKRIMVSGFTKRNKNRVKKKRPKMR